MNSKLIHPTAIVHSAAQLADDATVGPYAIIDQHVRIGPGSVIGAHAYITGWTTIGPNNKVHHGAVLGHEPQDLSYDGSETQLIVGAGNVFREYVTIHRGATKGDRTTLIGNQNYFMVDSHVGHNTRIGNENILANNVLLAGHVELEDQVVVSGGSVIHQFVRIGRLAIVRGGVAVGKDVPPFVMVTDVNYVGGLNMVGLRRAGLSAAARTSIKQAFRLLYRSGLNVTQALEKIRANEMSAEVRHLVDFVASSRRGICAGPKTPPALEDEGLANENSD